MARTWQNGGTHGARQWHAAGHLLTVRDGMLFSQPVDEQSLSRHGEPVRIADRVGEFGGTFGDASVTVSNNDMLAYGPRIVLVTSLQWRDRSGGVIAQVTAPGAAYRSPLLAPGERMVAFSQRCDAGRDDARLPGSGAGRVRLGADRSTISIAGGMQPRWSGDGKELFYLAPNGQLMAVSVATDGPTFSAAALRSLFTVEVPEPSAPFPTDYDVSADGQRFLVNTVVDQAARSSVTVILNWTAELKRD